MTLRQHFDDIAGKSVANEPGKSCERCCIETVDQLTMTVSVRNTLADGFSQFLHSVSAVHIYWWIASDTPVSAPLSLVSGSVSYTHLTLPTNREV